MNLRKIKMVAAFSMLLFLTACGGGYYKVTDPLTDKVYYTNDIEKEKGGAVILVNSNTGGMVTLQSSEVVEINKEEYRANTPKK